jgi:hypothetical protein
LMLWWAIFVKLAARPRRAGVHGNLWGCGCWRWRAKRLSVTTNLR